MILVQYLLVDIRKETKERPENTHLINPTTHTFYHQDGSIFSGRAYDFRNKYDLFHGSICNLLNGKYKTTKGWSLYPNQLSRQNDQ